MRVRCSVIVTIFVSPDLWALYIIYYVNVTYSRFLNGCLTKSYNTITIRELLLRTYYYCCCGFYTFYFMIAGGQGAVFTVSFRSKRQSAMNLFISPRVQHYIQCVRHGRKNCK